MEPCTGRQEPSGGPNEIVRVCGCGRACGHGGVWQESVRADLPKKGHASRSSRKISPAGIGARVFVAGSINLSCDEVSLKIQTDRRGLTILHCFGAPYAVIVFFQLGDI
jgi:hypothetical protein